MNRIRKKNILSILFFLIAIGFWGCSSKLQPSKKVLNFEEKRHGLITTFNRYWKLRTQGKYKQAWKFELPYYRFVTHFSEYKSLVGTYYKTDVHLQSIKFIHPNVAIVTRKIRAKNGTYYKKDKWIYVDRRWYHKFYQSIFPPSNKEEAEFQ